MRNRNIFIGSSLLVVVTFVGAFLLGRSSTSTVGPNSTLDEIVQAVTGNSPENIIDKNIKEILKSPKACQNSLTNLNPSAEGEEFTTVRDDNQNVIYQANNIYNGIKLNQMKLHSFKPDSDAKFGKAKITFILEKDGAISERSFSVGVVELEAPNGRLLNCQR